MGEVRIGIAGWSYRDWEGIVYPEGMGKKFDPLTYLADYFDLIEINVTFYRIPQPYNFISWLRRISHNPDFRFTVKLNRIFTHEKEKLTSSDCTQWSKAVYPLLEANRLGAVLAQFPYSFHFTADNRDYLSWLTEKFPEFPMVIEVRHRTWDRPEASQFLSDIGLGFCNIDQPRVSYSLEPSSYVTSSVGYVRLHGRNVRDWFRKGAGRDARYNYLYTESEIKEWLLRIKNLEDETRELYVITNNHYRGQAVCNALQLKSGMTRKRINIPESMRSLYPQLF